MSTPIILDASGQPARLQKQTSANCPRCGAGKEKRGPSGGFGIVHPTCQGCGYVFKDEVWNG